MDPGGAFRSMTAPRQPRTSAPGARHEVRCTSRSAGLWSAPGAVAVPAGTLSRTVLGQETDCSYQERPSIQAARAPIGAPGIVPHPAERAPRRVVLPHEVAARKYECSTLGGTMATGNELE